MLMWIRYSPFVAFVVNIVLFVFLLQFISEGQDIMSRLYIRDDEAVEGKLNMLREDRSEIVGNLDNYNEASFHNTSGVFGGYTGSARSRSRYN